MAKIINEKIKILRHFGIIESGNIEQKEAVRKILSNCKSEIAMEQKLYNVLRGNETLDNLIRREC